MAVMREGMKLPDISVLVRC